MWRHTRHRGGIVPSRQTRYRKRKTCTRVRPLSVKLFLDGSVVRENRLVRMEGRRMHVERHSLLVRLVYFGWLAGWLAVSSAFV